MIARCRAVLPTLSLALVALAAAGCGTGSPSDKAGGREQQTTVLRMANALGGTDELGPFLSEVQRLSRGAVRIDVKNSWRFGQVNYETGLIRDVRAGKAEIGWVGARAWDSLGVTSFDALNVPFLIDTYGLEQEVVRSSMIAQMLSRLGEVGVVPIGVLPGPLREALGRTPLRGPADFAGKTTGVQSPQIATATMRALGATPKSFPTTGQIGAFDGIEQQLTSIDGNGYDAVAKYVTENLKFWPRPLVLALFASGVAGAVVLVATSRHDGVAGRTRDAILVALPGDAGMRQAPQAPQAPIDAVADATALIALPEPDAGQRIRPLTPPDAETPNPRPTVVVQVVTRPGGASLYEDGRYRGGSGTQIKAPLDTKHVFACRLPGYKPGSVEINFNGTTTIATCVMQRIKICIDGIKNPFDDCEIDPAKPAGPAAEPPDRAGSATRAPTDDPAALIDPNAPSTPPSKSP